MESLLVLVSQPDDRIVEARKSNPVPALVPTVNLDSPYRSGDTTARLPGFSHDLHLSDHYCFAFYCSSMNMIVILQSVGEVKYAS